MAVLITSYKNVLLFKRTVTHLHWLCELKRYLCFICSSSFEVICGCIEWQGDDCVRQTTTNWIGHGAYNTSNLANDIALLRLSIAVPTNSEYPSPDSLIIILILIFINCNWVVTRWHWLFYMYTNMK
jgi:hypothetical protein